MLARVLWVVKNHAEIVVVQRIIAINRSKAFDPVDLLGKDWKIEEQDERSVSLAEVDLNKVRFVDMLKDDETQIKGEDKLSRLKAAGHIRLDAAIFFHLWKNQHLIPESWKEKINGNTRYIFFDGTVLRRPGGRRCILYLYWDGGEWIWYYYWLGRGFNADDSSAVLASENSELKT